MRPSGSEAIGSKTDDKRYDIMKGFIKVMGLTAVIAAPLVIAAEVDQANVNSFNSGDAAQAAEINQNFNALITAINDNAQQIAELRSDLTSFDVSGKKYQLYKFRTNVPFSINSEELTVTFEEGGALILNGFDYEAELSGNETSTFIRVIKQITSGTISWQRNGNVVEFIFSGGSIPFLVSRGANILTYFEADPAPIGTSTRSINNGFGQELYIGVEVPNP
jgi:hypothetical protein